MPRALAPCYVSPSSSSRRLTAVGSRLRSPAALRGHLAVSSIAIGRCGARRARTHKAGISVQAKKGNPKTKESGGQVGRTAVETAQQTEEWLNDSIYQFRNGRPLQSMTVPFRVVRKDDYSTRVDVLMVTTAKGKWTFPKGLVEVNETSRSTAHKEVLEEAGVKGTLYEDSYPPKFRMVKKDWGGIECEVTVFKMLVTRILAADDQEWLEDEEGSREFRERAWVPLSAAMGALHERMDPVGSKGKNRLERKGFQVAKTAARMEVMSVLRELRTLQRAD